MPLERKPKRPWIPEVKRKKRWEGRTNGSFYHSKEWRRLRNYFIKLHPLCEYCKEDGLVVPANVIDHIVSIRLGGAPLDENNLQSLCTSCHASKSAKEKK